jgi:hypothetical protein
MVVRYKLQDFKPIFEENVAKLAKRHEKGFDPNYVTVVQ